MKRLLSLSTMFAIFAIFALSSVSSASADSLGQCNNYAGNTITTTSEWQHALSVEGVTSQAASQIFTWAGYNHLDQTSTQWESSRLMFGYTVKPFSGHDFGCRNGQMFSAGGTSYAAHKGVMYALPLKYTKAMVHPNKGGVFTKRIIIKVKVVGLQQCGNTYEGFAFIAVYEKVTPKKAPSKAPKKVKVKKVKSPCSGMHVSGQHTSGSQCVAVVCGKVTVITKRNQGKIGVSVCSPASGGTGGSSSGSTTGSGSGSGASSSSGSSGGSGGATGGSGSGGTGGTGGSATNCSSAGGGGGAGGGSGSGTGGSGGSGGSSGNVTCVCVNNGTGTVDCTWQTAPPTPTCADQNEYGTYPTCYTLSFTPWANQEFYTNTQNNVVCVTPTGSGDFTKMKVVPKYENTTDGGNATQVQYNGETVWCDSTYSVGNDVPPGGSDTLTWVGTDANGNTVTETGSVTIVAAAVNYPPN
jgi:hypothetical protein